MKKVFATGIALAVLLGGNTATFAAQNTNSVKIASSDYSYSDEATQALNHINDIRTKMGPASTVCRCTNRHEPRHAKYEAANGSPGLYRSTDIFSITQRIQLLDRYPDLKMLSEVAVVKLGQLSLVFLPGEAFIQTALSLKAKFPQEKLMVMAYSDVSLEYVPIEEVFAERGGYETCEEWCFSVPGNAESLEEKAADLLRRCSGKEVPA